MHPSITPAASITSAASTAQNGGAQKWGAHKWGDGNIVALLSLKLLLLAFFILLNALSALEAHKAKAVLESVNKAFSGRLEVKENLSPQEAGAGHLSGARLMLDEVGQLFESMLPAVYRETTSHGSSLVLELSTQSLFRSGKSALQPGRGLLLDRLVAALNAERNVPVFYQFEFQQGTLGADYAAKQLAVDRAAAMAHHLVRRGVAAEDLSIGIAPIANDRLRFVLWVNDVPQAPLHVQRLDKASPGR